MGRCSLDALTDRDKLNVEVRVCVCSCISINLIIVVIISIVLMRIILRTSLVYYMNIVLAESKVKEEG